MVEKINKLHVYDEKEIETIFEKSKIIIFCITKQYYESKMFEKQWRQAVELKKKVLKVLLEDTKVNLEAFLNVKFEIYKNYENNSFVYGYEIERLIGQIENYLDITIVGFLIE